MKIKSFTLVEIMIASTIFMIVAIIAATSFAMIRRANDRATSLKETGECREAITNLISSEVRTSNAGKRVMGIQATGDDLMTLRNLTASNVRYNGIALFDTLDSYKAVYKIQNGAYLYREISFDPAQRDAMTAPGAQVPILGEALKISGANCTGFHSVGSVVAPIAFVKPFEASKKNNTIEVDLEDKLYFGQQNPVDDKNFAYMFFKVTNTQEDL